MKHLIGFLILLFIHSFSYGSNIRVKGNEMRVTAGENIKITTNTYTVGYSSATKFYGDGSNLTGIESGWVSTAESDLDMDNYSVVSATSISIGTTTKNSGIMILNSDPEIKMIDTDDNEYTRITRNDTDGKAVRYNRVFKPSGPGNSLLFDGTNENVSTGFNPNTLIGNGNAFSISLWLYPDSVSGFQAIVNSLLVDRFYLQLNGNQVFWGIGNSFDVNTGVTVAADGWYYLTLTYDGSDVIIYKNGINEYTASPGSKSLPNAITYIASQTGSASFFEGKIDEVKIYNVAKSSSWVTVDYNDGNGRFCPGDETGLIAQWRLDESSGSSAVDSSLNSNNGTLINMENEDWVAGKVPTLGADVEVTVWKSEDGIASFEEGIQTFGVSDGRTILDGDTLRFNISDTQKMQIDENGNVSIGTTTATSKLVVLGTITAQGLLDFSEFDDKVDALYTLENIKAIEGTKKVDHDTLGALKVIVKSYEKYYRNIKTGTIIKSANEFKVDAHYEEFVVEVDNVRRDVLKNIQYNTRAIQQLLIRLENLEK